MGGAACRNRTDDLLITSFAQGPDGVAMHRHQACEGLWEVGPVWGCWSALLSLLLSSADVTPGRQPAFQVVEGSFVGFAMLNVRAHGARCHRRERV